MPTWIWMGGEVGYRCLGCDESGGTYNELSRGEPPSTCACDRIDTHGLDFGDRVRHYPIPGDGRTWWEGLVDILTETQVGFTIERAFWRGHESHSLLIGDNCLVRYEEVQRVSSLAALADTDST